jgi:hypothetical protein
MSYSFPARFDGVCAADCGNRIHPGDRVRYDDDDRLRHDECTPKPDPLELRPNEVVCPDCWLVKPCRCDD